MYKSRARYLVVFFGALVLTAACSPQAPAQERVPSGAVPEQPPLATSPLVAPTGVTGATLPAANAVEERSSDAAPAVTVQADVGYAVGNRVPDFQLTLVDGNTFSSQDLISEGRPVFLFFTASW